MRATVMIVFATVLFVLGFGIWFLSAKSSPVREKPFVAQEVDLAADPNAPSLDHDLQAGKGEVLSDLEQGQPSPRLEEKALQLDDKSPSSGPDGNIDEEIAHFDRNALEFDRRRQILREELERGLLDQEASLSWENRTQASVAPELDGVEVRAQCSATICELILQSPHRSGTLLAHSARFLRGLHERTIGAPETGSEVNHETSEREQMPEGFSVLIRRDDQEGER